MPIEFKIVEKYPEKIFDDLVKRNLESKGVFIPAWNYCFEGDKSFKSGGKAIRIAAYDDEALIGLSWGRAKTKNRFIMHMSLVEREYRGKGIYTKMLNLVLEKTKEFDEVDSYHHMFNNKILALKLRRNFFIIGIDHTTMFGPRVRLRYFHNKDLFEIMKYRMGLRENPEKEGAGVNV